MNLHNHFVFVHTVRKGIILDVYTVNCILQISLFTLKNSFLISLPCNLFGKKATLLQWVKHSCDGFELWDSGSR